jgi:hypothetical protein
MLHIVLNAAKMLYFFPTNGEISDTLSPKTIMSGETLNYKKHLSLQVGQICQVHEEDTPVNSQRSRIKGAISLGPSGNLQGGYKIMALNTGWKITRRSWDVIPMLDMVIARVNALGTDQPEQLFFTDRCGRPIGDVEIPRVMEFKEEDDDDAVMPVLDPVGVEGVKLPGVDVAGQAPQTVEIDDLDIPQPDPPLIKSVEEPTLPQMEQDEPTQVAQPMQTAGLRRSTRVKLQPKLYEPTMRGLKYSYAVTQLETRGVLHPDSHMFVQEDFYQSDPNVMVHIMTQLSLKSCLKQWGDKAYAAFTSKMKQPHFRNTFKPKHWSELSKTQRQTVLESHMFLKEKRDSSLKGRTVAGGNKQRDYISKEDASSPTVPTEGVLLSCITNAEEERDVVVIDVPNAFIQTRVEDEGDMAIIKICGVLVYILVKIAPNIYKSYVTTDKKGTKQ